MKEYKIALLMTEGSLGSIKILEYLSRKGLNIDTVFVEKISFKSSLKRTIRKIMISGLRETLKKIFFVLKDFFINKRDINNNSLYKINSRIFYLEDFSEIKKLNNEFKNDFDFFLASTDSIIKRSVFSIPKYGTLNAHPAKNPEYRGLKSSERMLAKEQKACITLHLINEGIDLGPIILYKDIDQDQFQGNINILNSKIYQYQAEAFEEGINMHRSNNGWDFIDVFSKESNLY